MPRVEEAVFARVDGKWRLEGFFDDRLLIADVKRHIDRTYGFGNFFSVILPSGRWKDARFPEPGSSPEDVEEIFWMAVACPKCQAEMNQPCETARGNPSVRPHSQRVRLANQRALLTNLLV